jgi:hypothetical protein
MLLSLAHGDDGELFPIAFLQISFAFIVLVIPHRFPVQVPPPHATGAPPRLHTHRHRPSTVSIRGPVATKWSPHTALQLVAHSAMRLAASSVGAVGPPP